MPSPDDDSVIRTFFDAEAERWEREHGPDSPRREGFGQVSAFARSLARGFHAPPRVLDVGCATGAHLRALADDIAFGLGVDISEAMVAQARALTRELAPGAGNLAFRAVQVAQLRAEFDAGAQSAFDLVTFFGVLEHVPDQRGALRDCSAMLSPNGRIAIVTPHRHSPGFLLERLKHGGRAPRLCPTDRHFSLGALRRLAAECGLALERAEPLAAPASHDDGRTQRLLRRLDALRLRAPFLRGFGTLAVTLRPEPLDRPRSML